MSLKFDELLNFVRNTLKFQLPKKRRPLTNISLKNSSFKETYKEKKMNFAN